MRFADICFTNFASYLIHCLSDAWSSQLFGQIGYIIMIKKYKNNCQWLICRRVNVLDVYFILRTCKKIMSLLKWREPEILFLCVIKHNSKLQGLPNNMISLRIVKTVILLTNDFQDCKILIKCSIKQACVNCHIIREALYFNAQLLVQRSDTEIFDSG